MERDKLMEFLTKIFQGEDANRKSVDMILRDLMEILIGQNTPKDLVELVRSMIGNDREIIDAAKKTDMLDEDTIHIAVRDAEERKRKELEEWQSRC